MRCIGDMIERSNKKPNSPAASTAMASEINILALAVSTASEMLLLARIAAFWLS